MSVKSISSKCDFQGEDSSGSFSSAKSKYDLSPYFDDLGARFINVKEGAVLFRVGSQVTSIYLVGSGEVRAERILPNGACITFFRAESQDLLSEEAIFLDKHQYTAIAATDSQVIGFQKSKLKGLLAEKPEILIGVTCCLAQRYADSLTYRETATLRSAKERVLVWLRWQKCRNGTAEIALEGRMGGIGTDLGLTRESVYRAMKALEEDGQITRKQGIIALTGKSQ